MSNWDTDTICGISTGLSTMSALSVIRISGKKAASILEALFVKPDKNKRDSFTSHMMYYGYIEFRGEIIDEVMVCLMRAPKSYTKEDVCEIHCHGGKRSSERILSAVLENGARLAEPGEFTKRAFLNGRIDLSKAEAVMDIINSQTDLAHKAAVYRLKGGLSEKIREIRGIILSSLARIEVDIDYPEHDEESITVSTVKEEVERAVKKLSRLIKTYESGKIIKSVIKTVILCKPNVVKSSILNLILG